MIIAPVGNLLRFYGFDFGHRRRNYHEAGHCSLIKTYALQSLLLAAMALLFFVETGILTLLVLAVIILVSKALIIPHFMGLVQKRLNIKRDVKFHFLSPVTSLFISIFIILFVYFSFSSLLSELNRFNSNLFFLGATVGMSIVFMGMIVIFTRKQTITNIVGYLTMENGVVLFSLFLTELPLLIEVLIVVDLIMLTLLLRFWLSALTQPSKNSMQG